MRALTLAPLSQLAGLTPLAVRVILGIIMIAHGAQKLQMGPANFGRGLAGMGVPFPVLTGYVVTFTELIGGILLVVGLLSRLAALLLTVNQTVAMLLVNVGIGFLTPPAPSRLVWNFRWRLSQGSWRSSWRVQGSYRSTTPSVSRGTRRARRPADGNTATASGPHRGSRSKEDAPRPNRADPPGRLMSRTSFTSNPRWTAAIAVCLTKPRGVCDFAKQ